MVVVARSVPTQWGRFDVVVAVAMCLPVIVGLAKTSMSALLILITVSSAASIQQGDSDVNATQDSDSTLISRHVLVNSFIHSSEPT